MKEEKDKFDETMKDIKENLIARIQRQECEIHNLKAELEMYENGVYFSSENDKLQEEIERLNNIINELEKRIVMKTNSDFIDTKVKDVCCELYQILQELKGDSSNV